MQRLIIILLVTMITAFFLGGCTQIGELNVQLQEHVVVPKHPVVMFFVDGLRVDLMRRMAASGELPNIRQYLLDAGTEVEYAVTCVPSITYAVTASMSTGLFPGHHQIMGNSWFDPNIAKFQDYRLMHTYQQIDNDLQGLTIYQLLADKFTATIQTANRRGATRQIDNWASSGIHWFFKRYEEVDKLTATRMELLANTANRVGRWPALITAYFPAVDEVGHRFGADSKRYRDAIVNIDVQIGKICRALHKQGLLERSYRILVSDHGHVPAKKDAYWRPDTFLWKQLGISNVSGIGAEYLEYRDRERFFGMCRAVVVNGGYRRAHIHLRTGEHWFQTADFDGIESFVENFGRVKDEKLQKKSLPVLLAAVPAVRLVAVKVNEDTVELLHRDSVAAATRKQGWLKQYAYKVFRGVDPLEYTAHRAAKPLVDNGFFTADQWLQATCDSKFPDLVPQIVEMFDSPRAGQIVIFAEQGWDFHQNDLGGHGSVLAQDMLVPMVLAGPRIQVGGKLRTARLVDLMPTIIDMLGCENRLQRCGRLDGKSLMPQLLGTPTDNQTTTDKQR